MSLYRGAGGASDATDDSTVNAVAGYASSAASSAASAANSASAASTSATSAASSASGAASSAAGVATNATNAASSASLANTYAAQALLSKEDAAASASIASTRAGEASSSASSASSSASTATTKANEAAVSAANVSTLIGSGNGTFVNTPISTNSTVTLSSGTVNGVTYLNGSKVLTSGSALTFNGTNLGVNSGGAVEIGNKSVQFYNTGSGDAFIKAADDTSSVNVLGINKTDIKFYSSGSEGMRLTSTGLGIGTSSPSYKLDIVDTGGVPFRISNDSTQIGVSISGGTPLFGTFTSHDMTFGTQGSTRIRINGTSGNVAIGTFAPHASAILDTQNTTKGVRMPNMTTTQKNAIASPAAGLIVFDTTLAKLCVYTGAAWQTITSV